MAMKTVKKHKQIVYKPPPALVWAVNEDTFDYIVPCPICDKRSIDVSDLPENLIRLRYKCPHCNNLVVTPLVQEPDVSSMQLSLFDMN